MNHGASYLPRWSACPGSRAAEYKCLELPPEQWTEIGNDIHEWLSTNHPGSMPVVELSEENQRIADKCEAMTSYVLQEHLLRIRNGEILRIDRFDNVEVSI